MAIIYFNEKNNNRFKANQNVNSVRKIFKGCNMLLWKDTLEIGDNNVFLEHANVDEIDYDRS